PKSLLLKPYPENLPVVEICKSCNGGFSLDEEYLIAFLSCVLRGSTDPQQHENARVQEILTRSERLRSQVERSRKEYRTKGGDTRIVWMPETERVNRVVLKNARGHAFFEYGEPMLAEPDHVWSAPLESLTTEQRAHFESIDLGGCWPEVGSRMMTRVMSGQ